MTFYIGLMSGTSIDGIDCVLADFKEDGKPEYVSGLEMPWSPEDRRMFSALTAPGPDEIHRAGIAGCRYAERAAEAVKALLAKNSLSPGDIRAVASHGQTIRHEPEHGFTAQIGNHALLAALTGIDVVADFRSADIALGGQGAPLVPAFHQEILGSAEDTRFIINIGGISNVTALIPGRRVTGYDLGPGNTLMDLLALKLFNAPCDRDGLWASQGRVNEAALSLFTEDPFFKATPPKSTGRELFNEQFLMRFPGFETLPPRDQLATACELTARSIADGLNYLEEKGDIYICGGGCHNAYLIERIRELALKRGHRKVTTVSDLGIDPDFLEGFAFAWLGYRFIMRQPVNMTSVTGSRAPAVMGCLYPRPC